MKNQKGISLIALIITIIVIIILAAIVIGGVFNTPNDAKFANFCQEYDRVQTAIQLRYYDFYQQEAIKNSTSIATHYDIYYKVATGDFYKTGTPAAVTKIDKDGWVKITNWGTGSEDICSTPSGLTSDWFLRLRDGKLAYAGFEKGEADMYYTPNVHAVDATTHKRSLLSLSGTAPNQSLTQTEEAATMNPTNALSAAASATATSGELGLEYSGS